MYQALLTRKYLTSKIMPLLASAAVMLCVAMVLVVWSVMGGFLNKLLESGRTLVGDVTIEWPTSGFAHYGDLIKMLEADPKVAAASPMIDTFGMVSLPDDRIEGVTVRAIDPVSYARVVDYKGSLWWKPISEALPKDKAALDPRLKYPQLMNKALEDGLVLSELDPKSLQPQWACVPGIEMSGFSKRQPEGYYSPRSLARPRADGRLDNVAGWMPDQQITVRVVPIDLKGRTIDLVPHVFPVANEFRTGVFEVDRHTIFIPLAAGQQMMKMDEAKLAARKPDGAPPGPYDDIPAPGSGQKGFGAVPTQGVDPARVTTVLVRAADGVSADELRERCDAIYAQFAETFADRGVPSAGSLRDANLIRTWEMRQATFIGAVKKETVLVLFLFSIISLVASVLILAIFWAMISEKTKDIGVLRSLGASRLGIAWLWVRYGIVIGVLGAVAGGGLAWLVVSNINPIHDWLGTALGISVWDPRVYYFTTIPNQIEPGKAAAVVVCGAGLSVLGALIPALRAAMLDPVKALRFE